MAVCVCVNAINVTTNDVAASMESNGTKNGQSLFQTRIRFRRCAGYEKKEVLSFDDELHPQISSKYVFFFKDHAMKEWYEFRRMATPPSSGSFNCQYCLIIVTVI